jgi:hypothetical protein
MQIRQGPYSLDLAEFYVFLKEQSLVRGVSNNDAIQVRFWAIHLPPEERRAARKSPLCSIRPEPNGGISSIGQGLKTSIGRKTLTPGSWGGRSSQLT